MSVTVREALAIYDLRNCRVLAGQSGLDNPLDIVTVMEVPDIVRWLKGNELLLTSLFAIKEDKQKYLSLIQELSAQKTAALAIKPHRFIGEIPAYLLEEADRLGFPIIEIPKELSYIDILAPVMDVIYERKETIQQEDLYQAYQLLNEISRNKKGTKHFTQILKHLLQKDIFVEHFFSFTVDEELESTGDLFATLTEQQQKQLEVTQRPIKTFRTYTEDQQDYACIVAPILVDGEIYGTLTAVGSSDDRIKTDLAILERAVTLLSLEFMRLKVTYELEMQYKNDFFKQLLLENDQTPLVLNDKGNPYRFKIEKNYQSLSIHLQMEDAAFNPVAFQLSKLEHTCQQVDTDIIVGVIDHVICALYPTVNKSEKRIERELKMLGEQLTLNFSSSLLIGVGRYQEGIEGLKASYRQSGLASRLGQVLFPERSLIFYDSLGVYRLLAEAYDLVEIEKFHKETIGPLQSYDENHDLELLQSLRSYFAHNESLIKTAGALYVHVNTLKYRLQKVRAITNLNVQNSEEKLMLQMGLKIHDFLGYNHHFC